MPQYQIENLDIAALYQSYPQNVRHQLLSIRHTIFELSDSSDEIGDIHETLKWGYPSYETKRPKTGTPIRLQWLPKKSQYGVFVHCQTDLIARFRQDHPEQEVDKNRGILFSEKADCPKETIQNFLYQALTYHKSKDNHLSLK
ncbi:DUF1801 domain-containing protein [Sneathiella sp.]|uniref:DUF1801 domain-containing protein n=1 Tax=Sneathiella sp. TaxID=1964365 RepID=UPI0039E2293E